MVWVAVFSPALGATSLTLRVVSPEGEAIPNAVVRHARELDRHRVHQETGLWTASALYLRDGSELVFEKGMEVDLEVVAAGWRPEEVTVHLDRRRNLVEVVLEPMQLAPVEGAPVAEVEARRALMQWREADLAAHDGVQTVRQGAIERVEDWLGWLDREGRDRTEAEALCRMVHDHPERCRP